MSVHDWIGSFEGRWMAFDSTAALEGAINARGNVLSPNSRVLNDIRTPRTSGQLA